MTTQNSQDKINNSALTQEQGKAPAKLTIDRDVAIDITINNILVPASLQEVTKKYGKALISQDVSPGTSVDLKFTLTDSIQAVINSCELVDETTKSYLISFELGKEWAGDISDLQLSEDLAKRTSIRRIPKGDVSFELWSPDFKHILKEQAEVIDISKGGARIKTTKKWREGTVLCLQVKEGVVLQGEVRWLSDVSTATETAYLVGVRFKEEEVKQKTVRDKNPIETEEIRAIQETIKNAPADINHYNKLGMLFRKHNRLDEAVDSFQKALAIDDRNEVLHFNIARVYINKNELKKAFSHLQQALSIDSDFPEVKKLLADFKKLQ